MVATLARAAARGGAARAALAARRAGAAGRRAAVDVAGGRCGCSAASSARCWGGCLPPRRSTWPERPGRGRRSPARSAACSSARRAGGGGGCGWRNPGVAAAPARRDRTVGRRRRGGPVARPASVVTAPAASGLAAGAVVRAVLRVDLAVADRLAAAGARLAVAPVHLQKLAVLAFEQVVAGLEPSSEVPPCLTASWSTSCTARYSRRTSWLDSPLAGRPPNKPATHRISSA